MDKNKENDLDYSLDEQQVRVLRDLSKVTRQSLSNQIKEGLEMYIRFKQGDAHQPLTMFSPIVFERVENEQDR